MPEGKYLDDWPPFERIHSPSWRKFQYPVAEEWLNPTEALLDQHVKGSNVANKTAIIADGVPHGYDQVLRMVCKTASRSRC